MELSFSEKVKDLSCHHDKCYNITGRELFNSFGYERRSSRNCAIVDDFLDKHNVMVVPHYNDVWIDAPIKLMHKPTAKTKISQDSIKRVRTLEVANRTPVYINNSATLTEAITLMIMNDYSQLPVTHNGVKGLCGYISWKSIGIAINNGVNTNMVKDYKCDECYTISLNTPLLEAIKIIHQHEFVVVEEHNSICAIITTADISCQYLTITEPFVLLEEIENQIRYLLNDKFLVDDIKKVCQEHARDVRDIDDLTFGEYIALMQKDELWKKIEVHIDKKLFLKWLDEVREIRNDVMHFSPDGISKEQRNHLIKMAELLKTIIDTKMERT